MKKRSLTGNDSGVNILLEYLFSLIIMVILFSIMVMIIGDTMNRSDRIVLKDEFDIISNDVASRISAYSSEVYLVNNHKGTYNYAVVNDEIVYFDLPELVNGKQYKVKVEYVDHMGTITVTYMGDSNVYSKAMFWSDIPVKDTTFYSQQGDYFLSLDTTDPDNPEIEVGHNI